MTIYIYIDAKIACNTKYSHLSKSHAEATRTRKGPPIAKCKNPPKIREALPAFRAPWGALLTVPAWVIQCYIVPVSMYAYIYTYIYIYTYRYVCTRFGKGLNKYQCYFEVPYYTECNVHPCPNPLRIFFEAPMFDFRVEDLGWRAYP